MTEVEKIKQKRKKELTGNIVFVLIVAILFITIIIAVSNKISNKYEPDSSLYVKYDLSKDKIPEPKQKMITPESFTINRYGVDITIKKIATYDITGKVEAVKDFSSNIIANIFSFNSSDMTKYISPKDIALSWGEMALDENSEDIWASQDVFNGERRVLYRYTGDLISKYNKEYIESHISNNHIIALDDGIRNVLKNIETADVVRIVGYLVEVDCSNGWHWGPSSTSRKDEGCEIIYAEDIVIMPQN